MRKRPPRSSTGAHNEMSSKTFDDVMNEILAGKMLAEKLAQAVDAPPSEAATDARPTGCACIAHKRVTARFSMQGNTQGAPRKQKRSQRP